MAAGGTQAPNPGRRPGEGRADVSPLRTPDTGPDLTELILRQARATPTATAVWEPARDDAVGAGLAVSYELLVSRAAKLAHYLRAAGVGPDVMVAVGLDRSADQVIAALAVLLADGAYVPLDPSYPARRLAFMASDASAPVIVTTSKLAPTLSGAARVVVAIDGDDETIAAYPASPPARTAGPEDLAYVIYTSGSTGTPKGAMNTRRGLLNRLQWMQDLHRLTVGDAVLQKTPVGFDVSVWECFGPLIAGARIVVAAPDGHRDPAYLAGLIAAQGVTVAHFVPSMLDAFLDAADPRDCRSLRHVLAGGEVLPVELQRRFFASGIPASLDNVYGPSETAIDVTRWRCQPDWTQPTVPIGSAVPGTRVYLLDDRSQPVGPGREGEICVGGVQVGRGYLGRPELTARRFVPDPFSAAPGAAMYRTGDRARLRSDGALEFVGRLDDQIKINGVRIELGEIEVVLGSHPSVRRCAVTASSGETGRCLVAFVVPDGPAPGAAELRDHLAAVLPPAMLPADYLLLDRLPLSPNGKIDRAAFTVQTGERLSRDEPHAEPRSDIEKLLTSIWRSTLGVDQIGVHDNFFELGGHSLIALRTMAMIGEALSRKLTVAALYRYPTVAELSAWLTGSER